MSWKLWILAAAVIGVLFYLYDARTVIISGFQNPSDPNAYKFTMYYADWCGHCKTAKPGFESLKSSGPIIVNGKKCEFQMVSPEKEPEKAKGKPVRGFPTFLLESPDGQIVEYKGSRDSDAYLKFINDTLGLGAESTPAAAETTVAAE
jgi:thiol-disulfide isomerase/thioredoxin